MSPQIPVCPACGQKALPQQSHCLYCKARLRIDRLSPAQALVDEALGAPPGIGDSPTHVPSADATYSLTHDTPGQNVTGTDKPCPACGEALAANAILCVHCGFDRRLGRARQTVIEGHGDEPRGLAEETPTISPAEAVHCYPSVLHGLTLHNARILISLLGTVVILGVVIYVAAQKGRAPRQPPAWLEWAVYGGIGLWLLSIGLGLAGSLLCLHVPASSGARLPLAGALLFDLVTVSLGVIGAIEDWSPLFSWITGLCSWALFVAFLARLATYLDRPSEAREAWTILLLGMGVIAIPVIVALLTAGAQDGEAVRLTITVMLPGSGLLYFRLQFMVVKLLESLRESVRHQLDDARKQLPVED
jgi:hypothetical protein